MDPFLRSFREHAASDPAFPACIGPRSVVTRGELAAEVDAARGALARLGVGAGAIVGLVAPPGASFVAGWLALRAVDACALLIDPEAALDERRRALEALGAGHCWVLEGAFDPTAAGRGIERVAARGARLSGIAAIKLTSGSSGVPSGVAVRARELAADGENLFSTMGISARDRLLAILPFSHSYGFSLLPTALCLLGASLVLADGEDPLEVARARGATVLPSVPAWYQAQLRLGGGERFPASLRLFLSAGAPLSPATARDFRALTGRPIHVFYGSSECGGITYDRAGGAAERGTVGTPVDNVAVELGALDRGSGTTKGVGIVRVRSAAVAAGYHPRDPARAARLADGMFETEDLASFEKGELTLRGRRSRWVNVKGRKVDPLEVERVLEALPGVREAAVLGQPLPEDRGETLRAVLACEAGVLSYRDVVVWCRARLAAHKVPRSVILVRELPRNARGKLDREALGLLDG